MAEEAPASETSVTMPRLAEAVAVDETLNSSENDKSGISVDASTAHGVEESVSKAEASVSDPQKSLELANELMEKGNLAIKENDFGEAADNFSRALEIRVSHYGELAPECVHTYYKYGCALLYKAQEEADPLADVPKKEDGSQHDSTKEGPVKSSVNGESSTASFSSNAVQDVTSADKGEAVDDGSTKNDEEEGDETSDAEDLAEADEDETDLDLAWKMLDIARAIVEKQSVNTIEQVDILSTLADVALEREDFETSLSDYQKALSILEQLVEPDDRKIADLNFRICLCLEVSSKAQEAIVYCQKATSVCKARLHRLTNEVKSCSDLTSDSNNSIVDKQSEIEILKGLSSELERKLEDLQQLVSNPKSILAEILGIAAAKAGNGKESSLGIVSSSQLATVKNNGGFDSPSISTAHTNGSGGVTHLGVVGRGVKRASNASSSEGSTPKKPALESTEDKGDENAC
ncbi:NASP-related protein sim3 [Vigna radiata var. radiata]|uniref:NASP-related protein sim3 n=1 Tax=Vigna radiata var. radiata TaxID=3916 RepID=A0A1S3VR93_VIGRR|nr:NASP-related protein sim3 [Vigna radiata var. radiata]